MNELNEIKRDGRGCLCRAAAMGGEVICGKLVRLVGYTYPFKALIDLVLGHAVVLKIHEPHISKCVVNVTCDSFPLLIRAVQELAKVDYWNRRCHVPSS